MLWIRMSEWYLVLLLGTGILLPSYGLCQEPTVSFPFSGSAEDISGNGHHGTVIGAVLTQDRFGAAEEAYLFDGGDRISVADHPDITLGTSDFTLMAFLKISASSGFSYYTMGHSEGPGSTRKWILWITSSSIGIHVNGPSSGGFWITNHSWTPIVNEWMHCAVRREGDTFTVFVNAQPIGSNEDSRSIPDPSTPFLMGDAESQHPERDFRGSLDDVRLYHVALSDEAIEEIVIQGSTATETITWGGLKMLFR